MKLIADGGAITKNVTPNSRDAIILGLNTKYVDGFKLKLFLTKDYYIVTASDEVNDFFNQHLGSIRSKTLNELIRYNIGTHIHHQQILTLKEVLDIFKTYNKELVLELTDQQNQNAIFTDLVLTAIRPYADVNLYLESKIPEIISYLKSSGTSHPVGAVVTPETRENWYEDVDFYDIALPLIAEFDIREKVAKNKLIMLNQINTRITYDLVYQEYQDIFDSIFIITSFISIINQSELII